MLDDYKPLKLPEPTNEKMDFVKPIMFDFGGAWEAMRMGNKVTIDDKTYYYKVDDKLVNNYGELMSGMCIEALNSEEWHIIKESKKWDEEDIKMAKILLAKGYKYCARDTNNILSVFKGKPRFFPPSEMGGHICWIGEGIESLPNVLFRNINPIRTEPTSLEEIANSEVEDD